MKQVHCTKCNAILNVNENAGEMPQLIQCATCGHNMPVERGKQRYSALAVWSLVLGCLSFVCTIATGVPAVICGGLALQRIKEASSDSVLKGRKLAIGGIVLGFVGSTALFFAGLIGLEALRNNPSFVSNVRINGVAQLPSNEFDYSDFQVLLEPGSANYFWLHPINGIDPAQDDPEFNATFATMDYDDSGWVADPDEGGFGYGDPYGVFIGKPEKGDRFTAYFRTRFETTAAHDSLVLEMKVDDGAIIYIDGERVGDVRMGNRDEDFQTLAPGSGDEDDLELLTIDKPLSPGEHILAISVHNKSTSSSDLGISQLKLYGAPETEVDAEVESDDEVEE